MAKRGKTGSRTPGDLLKRLAVVVVGLAALAFAVQGGEYGTTDLWRQKQRKAKLLGTIDSPLGKHVTEEQMQALFGEGRHPNAHAIERAAAAAGLSSRKLDRASMLGRPYHVYPDANDFRARCRDAFAERNAASIAAGSGLGADGSTGATSPRAIATSIGRTRPQSGVSRRRWPNRITSPRAPGGGDSDATAFIRRVGSSPSSRSSSGKTLSQYRWSISRSTRSPSLRKSASCSIWALRSSVSSAILISSAIAVVSLIRSRQLDENHAMAVFVNGPGSYTLLGTLPTRWERHTLDGRNYRVNELCTNTRSRLDSPHEALLSGYLPGM